MPKCVRTVAWACLFAVWLAGPALAQGNLNPPSDIVRVIHQGQALPDFVIPENPAEGQPQRIGDFLVNFGDIVIAPGRYGVFLCEPGCDPRTGLSDILFADVEGFFPCCGRPESCANTSAQERNAVRGRLQKSGNSQGWGLSPNVPIGYIWGPCLKASAT